MIAAVIPAAGTGSRFASTGHSLPKQYQKLAGAPVYLWSLTTISRHPSIDAVVLVVSSDMVETARGHVKDMETALSQKVQVIIGGATRQQSVHNGIEHLAQSPPQPDFVLIHDAARPFLTTEMIDSTIKCVTESGACTLGVPLTDTIKRVTDGVIRETLDRSSLYLIQTPQAGRFDWLLAAHRKAAEQNFETTDDAAILEFGGHDVSIVPGSKYNLKITNPDDMAISEALAPIITKEAR
jgi:2-C-methyl-D-erythritol 4-phosphate cytidylyltransferase